MKISVKQYAQALLEIMEQTNEPQEIKKLLSKFVALLAKHNQLAQIDKILAKFSQLWQRAHGEITAEIRTAHDLQPAIKKILEKYLKALANASQLEIKYKQDKSILGGFVATYGDKILDYSYRNRLNQFKKQLSD